MLDVPVRVHGAGGDLLLLGHGGGASKDVDRFVRLSRMYAAATAMRVACVDAVDHGERRPPDATEDLPRAWHSRVMPQMVEDWRSVSDELGPAVAYVGFSMGSIFGLPTVAAIPTIARAVFVVGGIPDGWVDDPALRPAMLDAAGRLGDRDVLMLNVTGDVIFHRAGVLELFDAIPGDRKQLRWFDGGHDDWSDELLAASVAFLQAG